MNDKKLIEQKKCAPGKKYEDGSCFTLEALKEIADNYNKKNKDKIDTDLDKTGLVKELNKRLSNKCDEQTCWLRLDIAKSIDEDIKDNTFRPEGPSKKYEWLSTTHINDVVSQYQEVYKDFNFLGAVPLDFDDLPVLGIKNLNFDDLIKDGKTKLGLVINQDEHWKSGSHWVGLFIDFNKNAIYYFDSVGSPPLTLTKKFITRVAKYMYSRKYKEELPVNNILKILKKLKNLPEDKLNKFINDKKYLKNLVEDFDIRYNNIQHQFDNSECGVYSINFIVNLAEGKNFDNVINNVKKDEIMNQNRKIFFRNVN
jgi:hypothetical protein